MDPRSPRAGCATVRKAASEEVEAVLEDLAGGQEVAEEGAEQERRDEVQAEEEGGSGGDPGGRKRAAEEERGVGEPDRGREEGD